MNTLTLTAERPRIRRYVAGAEVKILTLREQATPYSNDQMDNPEKVVAFFRSHVARAEWFDPMKECLVVFMFDIRHRLMCWNLVSLGTVNQTLGHPREIFRAAIVAGATSVAIAHNHPSGDPSPSDPDRQMAKSILYAGQILKIDLVDSIVVGTPDRDPAGRGYTSLRELGVIH